MTISAAKDANRIPVLLGTLNTDGQTVKPIGCNPTNHGINCLYGGSGSGTTTLNAQRDANRNTAIWGVSSADGVTPVEIWCDANGNLLVDAF